MLNEINRPSPQTFDLRKALDIPADKLTFRQAVFLALELMKAASPVLAKHFDAVPNVLAAFEVVLAEYAPDVIREAVVRMMRSMKRETRDVIPDAPRLADYCEEIMSERRAAHSQRLADEQRAREQAEIDAERARREAMTEAEREAEDARTRERLRKLHEIARCPKVGEAPVDDRPIRATLTPEEFERRKNAAVRSLAS